MANEFIARGFIEAATSLCVIFFSFGVVSHIAWIREPDGAEMMSAREHRVRVWTRRMLIVWVFIVLIVVSNAALDALMGAQP